MPEESSVTLKSASDYQLLGKRVVNASAVDIVVGNPIFGIDATAPGMVYATYVKCPSIGGIAKSANLDAVKALSGVIDAFILEGTPGALDFGALRNMHAFAPGVAIVAKDTWSAFKARKSLTVEWDYSTASKDDSDALKAEALAILNSGPAKKISNAQVTLMLRLRRQTLPAMPFIRWTSSHTHNSSRKVLLSK